MSPCSSNAPEHTCQSLVQHLQRGYPNAQEQMSPFEAQHQVSRNQVHRRVTDLSARSPQVDDGESQRNEAGGYQLTGNHRGQNVRESAI